MVLKKNRNLLIGVLILTFVVLSPIKSQGQSFDQYLVLNKLMHYEVAVQIEVVGWNHEGFRINFHILEGRINGILNGEFVKDEEIIVNGSPTLNGDQTTILPNGTGLMNLKSKIVADDGTVFYLRYTGTFQLELPLKYPFVFLTSILTLSTETDNPRYYGITKKNYVGMGKLNLLTNKVSYTLYPAY